MLVHDVFWFIDLKYAVPCHESAKRMPDYIAHQPQHVTLPCHMFTHTCCLFHRYQHHYLSSSFYLLACQASVIVTVFVGCHFHPRLNIQLSICLVYVFCVYQISCSIELSTMSAFVSAASSTNYLTSHIISNDNIKPKSTMLCKLVRDTGHVMTSGCEIGCIVNSSYLGQKITGNAFFAQVTLTTNYKCK